MPPEPKSRFLRFASTMKPPRVAAGKAGFTATTCGSVTASETARRSTAGSKGRLRFRLGAVARAPSLTSTVRPSGAALATASLPRTPPAPERFSISTAWPSSGPTCAAISRAITSVLPPGGQGTTQRMARASCAGAGMASAAPNSARRLARQVVLQGVEAMMFLRDAARGEGGG